MAGMLKALAFAGMVGSASGMTAKAADEVADPGRAYSSTWQLTQLLAGAQDKTQYSMKVASDGQKGFIFRAQDVQHATNPSQSVRLGEKISPQALKKRFAGYEVRYTKGEDCLTCAAISGADGQIRVSFARDGRTIIDIQSYDTRSRDARGNTIGASLGEAIGSTSAQCDAGMDTTCASSTLKGLSYIVAGDDQCPITVKEKQPIDIPACARIAGFQILAIEAGATTTPASSSTAPHLPTELATTIREIADSCKERGLQVSASAAGEPGVTRIDLNGDGSQDFLFDSQLVCGSSGLGCSNRGCYLVVYKQFGPGAYRKVLDELYDLERFISVSKARRLNLIAYSSPGEFGRCKKSRNESCDYLLFWRNGGWVWQTVQ